MRHLNSLFSVPLRERLLKYLDEIIKYNVKYMKANIQILFILILLSCLCQKAISQDLDSLPQQQRDSILIEVAKDVVLKFGPGYYREYKHPVIKRRQVPPLGKINLTGDNAYRVFYEVIFFYDKTKELLEYDFAAKVNIWGDTHEPINVLFGNGFGKNISEISLRSTGDEINQVPYQQVDERRRERIKTLLENDEKVLEE